MADRCFKPTRSFYATINGSSNHYIRGMTYTIRDGNEELRLAAGDWANRAMIVYVRATLRPFARISGLVRTDTR